MTLFTLLLNPFIGLLPVLAALWYLRRHRNDAPGEGPVWLRGLCIVLLVLFVAGFGLCGAWGTVVGVVSLVAGGGGERGYAPIFLIVGGAGLGIAVGLGWAFRRLIRPTVAPAPAPSPYDRPPTDPT